MTTPSMTRSIIFIGANNADVKMIQSYLSCVNKKMLVSNISGMTTVFEFADDITITAVVGTYEYYNVAKSIVFKDGDDVITVVMSSTVTKPLFGSSDPVLDKFMVYQASRMNTGIPTFRFVKSYQSCIDDADLKPYWKNFMVSEYCTSMTDEQLLRPLRIATGVDTLAFKTKENSAPKQLDNVNTVPSQRVFLPSGVENNPTKDKPAPAKHIINGVMDTPNTTDDPRTEVPYREMLEVFNKYLMTVFERMMDRETVSIEIPSGISIMRNTNSIGQELIWKTTTGSYTHFIFIPDIVKWTFNHKTNIFTCTKKLKCMYVVRVLKPDYCEVFNKKKDAVAFAKSMDGEGPTEKTTLYRAAMK